MTYQPRRHPPLVLSLGSPPVRQPADILLLFFPTPLPSCGCHSLVFFFFFKFYLDYIFFTVVSAHFFFSLSLFVHSPSWLHCVGFLLVRFHFRNRRWVFDWGVAGRELSVPDGASEDEQGMFASSCPGVGADSFLQRW